MFQHLQESLEALHFLFGQRSDSLMNAFRQLIIRAHPTHAEVKILHGLARQILWQVQHGTPLEQPIDLDSPPEENS
jgi:tRNA C32,U32 (ribose-2'-O)-methylase TrmJ